MVHRPRIVVTLWEDVPAEAAERYLSGVRAAGAEAIELAAGDADVRAAVAGADGLMLTGGIDVDPARYSGERHPKVKETDPARDAMELAALAAALNRDIPVLAICRGHQLMNVGFGGALLQHVESGEHRADYRTEGYPSRWHTVRVAAPSRLADALGADELEVNSRHHQAVRASDLAPGLRAVAWADEHGTELVEGFESERHRWAVGVQWHPERPEPERPHFARRMRALFAAFVAATRPVNAR
jgi:putative glutamine amidotransferase